MPKRIKYLGTVREFPDDFSEDDIADALSQIDAENPQNKPGWKPKDSDPLYEGAKKALDSSKNVLSGALSAVTGIPAMIGEVAGIGKDAITGDARGAVTRAGKLGYGAANMFAQPIAQSIAGGVELASPDSMGNTNPDAPEWKEAQRNAGAQAGSIAVGELAGRAAKALKTKAPIGSSALKDPTALQGIANKAREYVSENPAGKAIEDINVTKPFTAVGNTVRAAKSIGARGVARAAEYGAKRINKNAAAPVFEDAAPPVSSEIPFNMPEEQPFTFEEQPVSPRNDIDFSLPEEPAFSYQEPTAPVRNDINFSLPEEPTFSFEEPAAPVRNDIEMSQPLPESLPIDMESKLGGAREPSAHIGDAEKTLFEQSVQPKGNINKLQTRRIAEDALKVAPELRGLTPGPLFDRTLHQSFKAAEAGVEAAENSVPPNTTIPKKMIMDQLNALSADFALKNMHPALETVTKVIKQFEDRFGQQASIPFKEFLDVKRSFLKEGRRAGNYGLRRAYGALMEVTKNTTADLAKANKIYATLRRATEYAGIDPVSGGRISDIGKAPVVPEVKAPGVGRDVSRGQFRMPL